MLINYIMTQIYFIFILVILLAFSIFNAAFEKRHDDKSVLEEKKVKSAIDTTITADGIARVIADVSVLF